MNGVWYLTKEIPNPFYHVRSQRKAQARNQEEVPDQSTIKLAPRYWTSQATNWRKKISVVHKLQSVASCYSSPKGLRQMVLIHFPNQEIHQGSSVSLGADTHTHKLFIENKNYLNFCFAGFNTILPIMCLCSHQRDINQPQLLKRNAPT